MVKFDSEYEFVDLDIRVAYGQIQVEIADDEQFKNKTTHAIKGPH